MVAPNTDRIKALEEGRKFYVGRPHKCGCVIKFVSSQSCHYCGMKKGREKLAAGACDKYKTPEKELARMQSWRKNNYEKYQAQWLRDETINARAAKRRCAVRNQTPDLTNEENSSIISLYSIARLLTEVSGIPYEVDHIKPVSKGGLHHPDNLQLLTRADNRKKGSSYL